MARHIVKKLKFVDEPPRLTSARREELTDLLVQLIDNPGKWAIVETRDNLDDRDMTDIKLFGGAGFRVISRKNDQGNLDIWACYKPEDE